MNLTNSSRTLVRLVVVAGMFALATSGYSFDGTMSGSLAAASVGGDGGGSLIETWFILMLALVAAAQWLDRKEEKMSRQRVRVVHEHLDCRQNHR